MLLKDYTHSFSLISLKIELEMLHQMSITVGNENHLSLTLGNLPRFLHQGGEGKSATETSLLLASVFLRCKYKRFWGEMMVFEFQFAERLRWGFCLCNNRINGTSSKSTFTLLNTHIYQPITH